MVTKHVFVPSIAQNLHQSPQDMDRGSREGGEWDHQVLLVRIGCVDKELHSFSCTPTRLSTDYEPCRPQRDAGSVNLVGRLHT